MYAIDSVSGIPGLFEGTLTSSSWGVSPYGTGLNFSDASDRLTVAAGETQFFNPYYPFSGVVILYLNTIPSVTGRDFDLFVRYDGSGNKLLRLFIDSSDDECKLSVDGVTGTSVSSGGGALEDGIWYLVHFQIDALFANLKVWVDGSLDSSSDFTDTALPYGDGPLYIGGDGATETTGLDGAIAFISFNNCEIDDDYVISTWFDPFNIFREEVWPGEVVFPEIPASAAFDKEPQLIVRYGSKEGLDLVNDYGLEEFEIDQASNLQQSTSKGVHGVSVKGGAIGEKIISLRGVIREGSQTECYYKLNRLSAHIKLLGPAVFWIWDDRMIYSMGGDITWAMIPGTGGTAVSWSCVLVCTDPFFSDTPIAEWQQPTVFPDTDYRLTNKGNAPTWPIIVISASTGEDIYSPLAIINNSVTPAWEFVLHWNGPLKYWAPVTSNILIDGSVREVVYTPGSGDPYYGTNQNANSWILRGDFIWIEGGPKGRESSLSVTCTGGTGTVHTLLRSQWY